MTVLRDILHAIRPGAAWGGTIGTWRDGNGAAVALVTAGYTAEARIGTTNRTTPLFTLTVGNGLTLSNAGTVRIALTAVQTWALADHDGVAVDIDVTAVGGDPTALARATAPIGDRVGIPS